MKHGTDLHCHCKACLDAEPFEMMLNALGVYITDVTPKE